MTQLSRRTFLGGMVATALTTTAVTSFTPDKARAHSNAGLVAPPRAPPAVALTLDDGKSISLQKLLLGHVSAVQLMFTSCSATCPIQGAVFAQAARELGARVKDARWLSLSIDPTRDSPQALRAWMAKFGAHPRWRAARPDPKQLEKLFDFLKARNAGPDRHTAQVYFFDRRAQLVMRSVDFPPASELMRVLQDLGART